MNNYLPYMVVMALVTYLIRMVPLTFFSEGNQKSFYKIISFLCTLCGVRRNDLPSHFYQRRQCSGIYCRLFDSLISGIQR